MDDIFGFVGDFFKFLGNFIIIVAILALISYGVSALFGEESQEDRRTLRENVAQCESLGGTWSGQNCYVDGKIVVNEQAP